MPTEYVIGFKGGQTIQLGGKRELAKVTSRANTISYYQKKHVHNDKLDQGKSGKLHFTIGAIVGEQALFHATCADPELKHHFKYIAKSDGSMAVEPCPRNAPGVSKPIKDMATAFAAHVYEARVKVILGIPIGTGDDPSSNNKKRKFR